MSSAERKRRTSRTFGFYLLILFFPLLLNEFLPVDAASTLRMSVYFLAIGFELAVTGIFLSRVIRWMGYDPAGKYTPTEKRWVLTGAAATLLAGVVLLVMSGVLTV
ncbi:MAG: hypothetical protein M1319_00495 [Chloroflexi bacterium]|nr:hypothetical protein [Chloroflexota bacterium]